MSGGFTSILAPQLSEYVAFKRALGRRYGRVEHKVRMFDRFVATRVQRAADVDLEDLISGWIARPGERGPATVRYELCHVRQFCLFLQRRDPTAYVPERGLAPRPPRFNPHILSRAEVSRLLRATKRLNETRRWPGYRALMFRTQIEILYCTGLRPGEAIRLRCCDLDLDGCLFRILDSKGKSRIVPFSRSLGARSGAFMDYRRRVARTAPDDRLFIKPTGGAYGAGEAGTRIRHLLAVAGIRSRQGRQGPRPYDLRHTFAVHRLTAWYRSGVDLFERLPLLSAYMGHDDLLGTEIYLTATPELLDIASRRFAARLRRTENA